MANFRIQLGVQLDKNASKSIGNQLNNQKITVNISKFNITKSAISDIKKQLNSSSFSININASAVNKQINSVVANINKMNKLAIGLNNLDKLNIDDSGLQQRLASITKQFDMIKRMSDLGAQSIALSKLDGDFKLLASDVSIYNKELINSKSVNFLADQAKAVNNVKKYINENTKAAKEYGDALEEARNKMQNATNVKELTTARKQFAALTSEIQASGNSGRSFGDELKNSMSKFSQWISAGTIVMQAVRGVKDLVKNVIAIDSAMTNLYKVTDETDKKYSQFLTNASAKTVELGRSLSSLIEMSAIWAKLGFSLDDSAKLSEVSAIYANVGEVDDETAVKDIVTALKSFNIEAKDAITVVDKLNKLGNEFATDSASLGDGLKNAASALAFAGNDINQALAMITGGSEITQNASEQSNAIKILSMRLRGMKGDLEKLGEEYENVESISKIQTQVLNLTKGSVNIFDDNGNFKSTYEIIEKIAKVWDDISHTDQAELLEIIAGKQRGNQVAALIQSAQSGQMQKALEASINSEGSALTEQERWLDSIEAKLQQFQATWESLSVTMLDSDGIKVSIDLLTDLLQVVQFITEIIGSAGTIGAISGGILGAKGLGWTNVYTDINSCRRNLCPDKA